MFAIRTSRLDLVPGTIALLDAELESNDRLALLLSARIPAGWPPGEYDEGAIRHFRKCLAEHPESSGWYSWYALLRGSKEEPRTLIAAGGYFGPPNEEGLVEIGYSVVQEFERRGYATELVTALVEHACKAGRVRRIIAHTAKDNTGSARVLERAGFQVSSVDQRSGVVEYALECSAT